MIVRNDGPVKMTMQDLLKIWTTIPLEQETEGGDQDANPYLLGEVDEEAI